MGNIGAGRFIGAKPLRGDIQATPLPDGFVGVVMNARQRYRQPSLLRMSHAAEALHRNYYRRKRFLDADAVREEIQEVEAMVEVLQPFIE